MSRRHDTQRSRVYAWERAAVERDKEARFETNEEVDAYMRPIWRAERGRYGLAKRQPPTVDRPHRGQRSALAFTSSHRMQFPKWARVPSVILHETAHCLAPGDRHGPRFVGVFIGLLARHAGMDAYALMARADEMGLAAVLPCSVMEAAFELDCTWRQVHGYALQLIRTKRARFYRNRIVAVPA